MSQTPESPPVSETVVKIVTEAEYKQFQSEGVYNGAPIDLSDGFMHFSDLKETHKTLELYFKGMYDPLDISLL